MIFAISTIDERNGLPPGTNYDVWCLYLVDEDPADGFVLVGTKADCTLMLDLITKMRAEMVQLEKELWPWATRPSGGTTAPSTASSTETPST